MSVEVTAAVIGALAGALFGIITSVTTNWLIETWRRRSMWAHLDCSVSEGHDCVASVRVHNRSNYPMHNCWAYIAFDDIREDDIIADSQLPSGVKVHFHKQSGPCLTPDREDRLHWAYDYAASVDILPGEQQALRVFRWLDVATDQCIGVFTEQGDWIKPPSIPARVLLQNSRPYQGYIKIVSDDMVAKQFRFTIKCPLDPATPIKMN
jgi:hypothetical protein